MKAINFFTICTIHKLKFTAENTTKSAKKCDFLFVGFLVLRIGYWQKNLATPPKVNFYCFQTMFFL